MAALPVVYNPALKNCKDCFVEFGFCQRPAPYAGPRCRTHALAKRNADRLRKHRNTVEQQFNLEPGEYDELKGFQGNACAICRKAKGITRNLAVDHDHSHCPQCKGKGSCGNGVRGLLCGRCNTILAYIRDDVEAAARIVTYLKYPPLQQMRAQKKMQALYESVKDLDL